MARYVCDFNELNNQSKKLKEVASNMKSEVSTYKSKISEDLSGWNSPAKTDLFAAINKRTPRVEDMAQTIDDLGNFINEQTNKINNLEEKLATFNI